MDNSKHKYPVAEIFTSIQGEGYYAGSRTLFVRLAECTVGKPWKPEELQNLTTLPTPNHEKCTSWDGDEFICDANYSMSDKLTPAKILEAWTNEPLICITGGEPIMHNLEPLIEGVSKIPKVTLTFETSGTISLKTVKTLCEAYQVDYWVTVSPKKNYLAECLRDADELKILIDRHTFNKDAFQKEFYGLYRLTYIQPVNGEYTVDMKNVQYCLKVQQQFPLVILSVQLNKLLGFK